MFRVPVQLPPFNVPVNPAQGLPTLPGLMRRQSSVENLITKFYDDMTHFRNSRSLTGSNMYPAEAMAAADEANRIAFETRSDLEFVQNAVRSALDQAESMGLISRQQRDSSGLGEPVSVATVLAVSAAVVVVLGATFIAAHYYKQLNAPVKQAQAQALMIEANTKAAAWARAVDRLPAGAAIPMWPGSTGGSGGSDGSGFGDQLAKGAGGIALLAGVGLAGYLLLRAKR